MHFDKTYIFFGDEPKLGRKVGPADNTNAIGLIDDILVPATCKAGQPHPRFLDAKLFNEPGSEGEFLHDN